MEQAWITAGNRWTMLAAAWYVPARGANAMKRAEDIGITRAVR